jgi:hypothetical protein
MIRGEADMNVYRFKINIISLLLCAALLMGAVFLGSCGGNAEEAGEQTESETELPMLEHGHTLNKNGLVDVVVLNRDIKKGQKISVDLLEIVEVSAENLPSNVVSKRSAVLDKYALRDFYEGDYIMSSWLVDERAMIPHDHLIKKPIETVDADYVTVSDYVYPNTGEDLYIPLQELIDKNPGRTIYFPDGEYVISQSLLTSSRPADSISFQLSSGATLKAAEYWESDGTNRALISLGSYEKVNDITTPGSNFSVMGGVLDGNGIADGVAIAAGRETLIKDVVIVNVHYGIHVKQGTNGNSADADVDDVTIIGNGDFDSVGVCFSGDDNTISNARISNVKYGMVLSATTFVSSCVVENTMGARGTAGYLIGGRSYLSDCISINFDTAFEISGVGYAKQCSAIWTVDEGEKHVAFLTARLKFMIHGCKAEFISDKRENFFLVAYEDGYGGVVAPIYDPSLIAKGDMTQYYLSDGTSVLDILS